VTVAPAPTADISAVTLLQAVLGQRRTLAAFCLIFAAAAGIWQVATRKDYRATVLISIVSNESSSLGALGQVAGQLSSITSLVGLGGLGNGQRPEPVAVLKSRALTRKFISDNNLMPILFDSRWDPKFGKWLPSKFRKEPTLWDGYEKFDKLRNISQDSKTNLITLSVTWNSPTMAAEWANGLVRLTNEFMRQRALTEAQRNISYLTDQIAKTNLVELRSALGTLIQNQVKQQMLATGTEEFAFKVLDPAVVPQEPSSPGFIVSVVCGALGGLLIFVFALFARLAMKAVV